MIIIILFFASLLNCILPCVLSYCIVYYVRSLGRKEPPILKMHINTFRFFLDFVFLSVPFIFDQSMLAAAENTPYDIVQYSVCTLRFFFLKYSRISVFKKWMIAHDKRNYHISSNNQPVTDSLNSEHIIITVFVINFFIPYYNSQLEVRKKGQCPFLL